MLVRSVYSDAVWKCKCQWRRQNVKTARSFPGQYGRKADHSRFTICSK